MNYATIVNAALALVGIGAGMVSFAIATTHPDLSRGLAFLCGFSFAWGVGRILP